MSRTFGIGFGAAVLVIIGLVWGGFIFTKGNHLAPDGWISGVRAQQLTPDLTMLVIDFGIVNDSDVQMVTRSIDPWVTTADGREIHGTPYASADMAKTSSFYPDLGPMIHPVLKLQDTIDGHKTVNRMVGAGFEMTAADFSGRKGITLRIEDMTGPFVEMTSK